MNTNSKDDNSSESTPIGGWLILLGINLVIAALRHLFSYWGMLQHLLSKNMWAKLAGVSHSAYWISYVIGEFIGKTAIVFLFIYLNYLFFEKKARFPIWFVIANFVAITYLILDSYIYTLLLPGSILFNPEMKNALMLTCAFVCFWSAYLFISQRAIETFNN